MYLFKVELDIDDSKQTFIVVESCMANVETIIYEYAYESANRRWKINSIIRIGNSVGIGKSGKEFNNIFRRN